MKLLFLISVNFMMLMPVFSFASDQSFSGVWAFRESVAREGKPYSTFVVRIDKEKAGNISGPYCFITRNGSRIDCGPDGERNVSGRIEYGKNKAHVDFYSFFGAMGGAAEIKVNGDRLLWNVVKQPEGGGYYGPIRVEMRRDDLLGYRLGERKFVVKKAFLYDFPSKSQVTRAYVIKGDSVRVVEVSADSKILEN
ncbi:hypothetical protein HT746_05280 [Burkholderia pyrrocinia]|uniref:hypothetical protein n=1 Tax=Burkholderia pyrrocinia TaxID=60550 RepID=UPI00157519A9|nr:hypothetical protein [Burkholderia pyrrocinia]NTX26554.1 hypothetical protein [Burkholderia pyrrocinia]